MAIHILKTYPDAWDAVDSGHKTFECRDNSDRDFNIGDEVYLVRQVFAKRTSPADETINPIHFIVPYVMQGPAYGLPANISIISIGKRSLRGLPDAEGAAWCARQEMREMVWESLNNMIENGHTVADERAIPAHHRAADMLEQGAISSDEYDEAETIKAINIWRAQYTL